MSRHLVLLWLLAVWWPVLFGFPGLRAPGWLAPARTSFEGGLALVAIGAVLLALATAASVVQSLSRSQLTYAAIAGSVAPLTYFCGVVTLMFWIGGTQASLAAQSDPASLSPGRLDRFCDPTGSKTTQLAARFLYGELGVCLTYQREDDSLLQFQPTDDDREKRRRSLESQLEFVRLRDKLAQQARFSRAAGSTHLGALPIAFASYLLWTKRRKRSPDAESPKTQL
ncbi:MAG TPA: hypothetical protein VEX18_16275 [Polyangiaceae bacterium]|nr:hypothetical protein [Polyangiaceae bacterium]